MKKVFILQRKNRRGDGDLFDQLDVKVNYFRRRELDFFAVFFVVFLAVRLVAVLRVVFFLAVFFAALRGDFLTAFFATFLVAFLATLRVVRLVVFLAVDLRAVCFFAGIRKCVRELI